MSDISLSKAVRSNLLSLQNTSSLLAKTQDRLASGNKVNSALDNPTNFFTAQSLNSRSGDLNNLMDGMANGIQTLEAADNGLTSITKTLESMQSTLRQARQDKSFQTQSFSVSATATGNLALSGGAIGSATENVKLENTALTATSLGVNAAIAGTAGTAGPPATAGTAGITFGAAAVEFNDNAKVSFDVTVDSVVQKVEITKADVLKAGNGDSKITDATEFASILSKKLNGATAAASGTAITLTSATTGAASNVSIAAATVSGTAYSSDELVASINSNTDLTDKVRASNDNGKLRLENLSTEKLNITGASTSAGVTGGTTNKAEIGGNTVRADLANQFNELRDQLDKLADDASFNGINLLRGDKLTITFNETGTSSIDIQTKGEKQVNSSNLGVSTTLNAKDLDTDANIDGELAKLKTALNDVRSQSSAFGSNLSIVQNRQDFTKSMINTLQTGAANLTLADMNEEAANLLALQTRQSLSSNSLSLASQADQSVLQLIR